MEDQRSLTSAINGAQSAGPVTPEGKTRSSRNSEKHGMYSNAVLLAHECAEAFATHRDGYYQRFLPATPPEKDLVDQMISATWRLRRLTAVESAALDQAIDAERVNIDATYDDLDAETRTHFAFLKLTRDSAVLATYQRFQSTLLRQYDRALGNLQTLRKIEK